MDYNGKVKNHIILSFKIIVCFPISKYMIDQRRQDKSWNDPPMFSPEQINQAANTGHSNKRYRYPQQQAAAAAPAAAAVNPRSYPNYQAGAMNSYGNYNNTNSSMAPAAYPSVGQPQQQQYPATYSPYPNANPTYESTMLQQQQQNYSPQSINSNPYNNPITSFTVGGYPPQPQTTRAQSIPVLPANNNNNSSGYAAGPVSSMPNPYGTVTESNLVQQPPSTNNTAANPPIGFNLNSIQQQSQQVMPQSLPQPPAPGFNYNHNNPQQQQYPYRQY